jgi:hypothetical protein
MKPRHAAALALVGWYLLCPPLSRDRRDWSTVAPLSQWTIIKSFHSQNDCHIHTQEALEEYRNQHFRDASALTPTPEYEAILRCIATDDPRLNKNIGP